MAQVLAHLHEQASPQALGVILLLFVVAMYLAAWTSRAEKLLSKLPTPPFKLPVIGHLHLVGSLPHVSLRALAMKHGPDVMLIRLGAAPAQAVPRTHDSHFASRPRSAVGDVLFYGGTNVTFSPSGGYCLVIFLTSAMDSQID